MLGILTPNLRQSDSLTYFLALCQQLHFQDQEGASWIYSSPLPPPFFTPTLFTLDTGEELQREDENDRGLFTRGSGGGSR